MRLQNSLLSATSEIGVAHKAFSLKLLFVSVITPTRQFSTNKAAPLIPAHSLELSGIREVTCKRNCFSFKPAIRLNFPSTGSVALLFAELLETQIRLLGATHLQVPRT